MATIINTTIPDIDTSWENYSGEKVEEFIKKQLSSLDIAKGSYLALLGTDEATNMATVGIFASAASYAKYAADKESYAELLLSSVEIPMGSGSSSTEASYIVKLVNKGSKSITATKKADLIAKIRFTSQLYDPSDKSLTDTNENATLQIETRMQSASDWKVAGTIQIQSQSSEDATSYTEIDLSPYINDGTQSVRLLATGELSEKKTSYVAMTVTLTNITITFQTSWQKPFEYKPKAPTITVPVLVTGTISKTLNLKVTSLDGTTYSRSYEYSLGTATYTETPYSATIDHPKAHGIYSIEAWITSGDAVTTSSVTQYIMCTLAESTAPLLVVNNIGTFQNWSNVTAFSYAVYNPNNETTDVSFTLTNLETSSVLFSEEVFGVKNGEEQSLVFDLEVETESNVNFPASMTFMSGETELRSALRVVIDNSENFAPTSGADFFLNPKLRNNTEASPATIINAMTGEAVDATFEGFSFVSDGWVKDSNTNSRCLRVLDGEKVNITYDAYSDDTPSEGLTIEIDFATRNVTDEDKTLFKMGTASTTDEYLVGFWLKAQESCFMTMGKRTEGSQNWIYSKETRTHVAINIVPNLYNQGTNYVRVFINGIISREFVYADSDSFWQSVGGIKKTGGIVIAPEGADLDIYGLRIYKTSMSATQIRQNRLSSFATIDEKKAFKNANDILGESGLISYTKAYDMYNTLLYKGSIPSLKSPENTTGDVVIHKPGDPSHSGTLYGMTRKGQGSTSKKYWTWNIQSDFKGDAATNYWEDENGVNHGQCYQNADGLPMAKKLVDKRNWASSMQSHKMGATKLYNDLYQKVVGTNEITSMEGFENCRVCVYEEPFLVFQQETDDDTPTFIGMGTFGSGKADKPTFGYDKTQTPNLMMIEGSDNNPRLTKHQVPWIDGDVYYDEEEEGYVYAGTTSWDFDMGNQNTLPRFIEAFNFVYSYGNRIKAYNGTYTQLKAASDSLDISYQYWVSKVEDGSARYDLYRYEENSKTWVPAGTTKAEDGTYATLNVKEQVASYLGSDFTNHETYLEWDKVNEDFIAARKQVFTAKAENYFHKKDILFSMAMMKLFAACDNRAKNTYLWVFDTTSKIRAFQDDLDSILPIDNQGKLTKPYYVEEHDYDESLEKNYWNGEDNVLYNMMEECFATDLRETMKSILGAMASLGGSVDGCWEKYFMSTCQYFPAVAYNEFARIGYEYAKYQMTLGNYSNDTDPITQSLGSQEEGERQWCKDRTIYMSSYGLYGEFNPTSPSGGNINYRSIKQMTVTFNLTVARWLYPVVTVGQSTILSGQRMKAGETVSVSGVTDSNTQNIVCGVNYMSDIGTWYDKPANETLALNGSRVKKLVAGTDNKSDINLKATALTLGSMTSLRSIDVHNLSTLTGTLDCSKNTRLESLDARGTSLTDVTLPEQEFLTTLKLPSTITTLSLDGQTELSELTLEDWSKIQTLYFNQSTCPKISALDIIAKLKECTNLSKVTILGIEWTDVDSDTLSWLLDHNAKLTGKITLSESVTVNATLKMRMVGMWGNVDDETNSLYVTYTVTQIKSATLKGTRYFKEADKTYSLSLSTVPAKGNDITGISWSMTENAFATIDSKTGVITVKKIGSKANDDKATVTAVLELSSGKTLEVSTDVYFYPYEAKVGDYVFADGTYGGDQKDTSSTPIGVIFYIEPKQRKYAIAVAFKNIGGYPWGLWNSTDANNGMAGIKLAGNANYDVYDVPTITDCTQRVDVSDANMRDESNTDNDGFKDYGDTLNTISDIGFEEITESIYNLSVGDTILGEYLDAVGLGVGDMISRGQLNTLKIIAHRDYILQDSNVNQPVPKATSTKTLKESLAECISNIQSKYATKYQQYYYPAASYCQAYTPVTLTDEELDEQFTEGHWFLPSSGEWARISWYAMKGYTIGADYNIFAQAVADYNMSKFDGSWQWLSSENCQGSAWVVNPTSGQFYVNVLKCYSYQVRAVVAFRL